MARWKNGGVADVVAFRVGLFRSWLTDGLQPVLGGGGAEEFCRRARLASKIGCTCTLIALILERSTMQTHVCGEESADLASRTIVCSLCCMKALTHVYYASSP